MTEPTHVWICYHPRKAIAFRQDTERLAKRHAIDVIKGCDARWSQMLRDGWCTVKVDVGGGRASRMMNKTSCLS